MRWTQVAVEEDVVDGSIASMRCMGSMDGMDEVDIIDKRWLLKGV